MNMKDLSTDIELGSLSKYAEEMKQRFAREVDERVAKFRTEVEALEYMPSSDEIFAQVMRGGAQMFVHNYPGMGEAAKLYKPTGEADARLNISSYSFDLGRYRLVDNLAEGARFVLLVFPLEKKP